MHLNLHTMVSFQFSYNLMLSVTPKIAFQYCTSPKTDRPTVDQIAKYQFIIVDEWFCYPDFQNYYGPSNLAHVKRFCQIIEELYEVKVVFDEIFLIPCPRKMEKLFVCGLVQTPYRDLTWPSSYRHIWYYLSCHSCFNSNLY